MMKGITRIKSFFIVFSIMPFLLSCATEIIRKETIGPKAPEIVAPVIPVEITDNKIAMLEEFSKNDRISGQDLEMIQDLLSCYKKIRSATQGKMSETDYQKLVRTLFNHSASLAETYFLEKIGSKDLSLSAFVHEFSSKEREIWNSYLSGDYGEAISKCSEYKKILGTGYLPPDIGLLFALSLAENNMLEEAIEIGKGVARQLEAKPDLIHLRTGIIDWLLKQGEEEEALKVYEKLVDNINERDALFDSIRRIIAFDKAESTEAFVIEDLLAEASNLPDPGPTKDVLEKVERLIMENSFSEARLMLLRRRLRVEESPEAEIIEKALNVVNRTEETHQHNIAVRTENIAMAEELIEKERFRDALEILNNEQEPDPEIEGLKELAVERLINRERDRAARIFLMAKNTENSQNKKELLLSSYDILKELIETYPSSTLINKLNNNLSKVEEELEKLVEY
jgi:hypothetical protein